ncbi:hypothetical protein RE6C_04609 [Rhodopirellula europaea 6C]|uniref:Uncharacterized protein n=1 Tax=Rhodopirellula europaea 6C TaxID=1263867 RepID=M2APY9_9BACT|nr:hypothetical protein RE6C_04609 [Rhodopirellula europaea 6C]
MKKTLSLRWFIIAGWATAVMVGVRFLRKFCPIFGLSEFVPPIGATSNQASS